MIPLPDGLLGLGEHFGRGARERLLPADPIIEHSIVAGSQVGLIAGNFHNTIRKSLGALAPGKWREVDAAERVAVFT